MSLSHPRQTKIVATLGPASYAPETLKALIQAGVNLFRMNFSHGDHAFHRQCAQTVRALSRTYGKEIGLIADLQGPKLRIGTFKNGEIPVSEGQIMTLDADSHSDTPSRIPLPHPEILDALAPDMLIFFDDGNVRARVLTLETGRVTILIESGKRLTDRKGLNVPEARIALPALTEKDRKDLDVALDMGADWIAQSFVQTPDDVKDAREAIAGRASLMVKLEKPSALEHLDMILKGSDAVLLARGDLGVEIPPERVPAVQKQVIQAARDLGKPVVVATQMLESMVHNARPTRAEASDIATAVYDGTDAVMLSAETATGAYPIESVEIMARICKQTEGDGYYPKIMELLCSLETQPNSADAITAAARRVAQDVGARFIVTYTSSGSTALRMARQRPNVPILCLTPDARVAQRLSVCYGVRAIYTPETLADDFSGPARHAARIACEAKLADKGDSFVMTAGVPFGEPGSTTMLRISTV